MDVQGFGWGVMTFSSRRDRRLGVASVEGIAARCFEC